MIDWQAIVEQTIRDDITDPSRWSMTELVGHHIRLMGDLDCLSPIAALCADRLEPDHIISSEQKQP